MEHQCQCCTASTTQFSQENPAEEIDLNTFVSLMEQFYHLGWMRGTGGAMGCRSGTKLMMSPSSLQKERLHTSDIFVFDADTKQVIQRPNNMKVKETACGVLFEQIMNTTGAGCVIHTHSKSANLLTQLIPDEQFKMSHQEYIKGIYDPIAKKNLRYNDTLIVPIVGNKPREEDLLPDVVKVLQDYQMTSGMLVRNHGLFVWGPTWEQTKIMTECYDYLFDLAVDMIQHKLPLVKPEGYE